MSLASILEEILVAPGALGAAFLDPQGEMIAHVGDTEFIDILAAYQSVWLGELGRAATNASLGTVTDLSMDFSTRRVLAGDVKDGYFVLVVLDALGVTSLARVRLADARVSLAAEIG